MLILYFNFPVKNNSLINKLIKLFYLIYQPDSSIQKFREGWGNDEIAFEVPGVKIPCASIHRGPHLLIILI